MTRPINFNEHFRPDRLAENIAERWVTLDGQRSGWKDRVLELRDYLFATDTKTTSNSKLPWKNSTTLPKLTAMRDILHAQMMLALFPNADWFVWQARDQESANKKKSKAISAYMRIKLDQSGFRSEVSRMVYDLIDTGNCFGEAGFRRETKEDGTILFEGPIARRISPYDLVFDPTVDRFSDSPVIIRRVCTTGELIVQMEDDPGLGYSKEVVRKLIENKGALRSFAESDLRKHRGVSIDGFGDMYTYVNSDLCEILEFQGDWYDSDNGVVHRNQRITVLDRMYVLAQREVEAYMKNSVFHAGWRERPDNLWCMGPLDNLVGMQYRIDHIENAKADAIDEFIHPKKIIKGYVEDFDDVPGERIYVGDDGAVEFVRPDLSFLQYDQELQFYIAAMEEMAGVPKDLAGIRTPGNKTLFEVEQLRNNGQALFLNRTSFVEENYLEKLINAMLDLSIRRMGRKDQIAIYNEDFGITEFIEITPEDLTGNGLIKPIGARRFQTQQALIQNLTNFANSPLGQDPAVNIHISGLRMAQLFEELLGVERFNVVRPNIRIFEQTETQKLAQAAQDEVAVDGMTSTETTG